MNRSADVTWVVCVVIALNTLQAGAMDADAVAILRQSAQNYERINSVQFSAAIKTTYEPRTNGAREFEDAMVFTYAKGKQRSEVQLTDRATKERLHCLSIFDGGRYQFFDENTGELKLSNSTWMPNMSMHYNPLEMPYMFLSKTGPPVSFMELRASTTWSAVFPHAAYLGSEVVNGVRCEKLRVPSLALPTGKASWTVFFAPELNYYPIRAVAAMDKGDVLSLIEVRSHEVFSSDGVRIVIPTDILITEYPTENPSVVPEEAQLLVDRGSIKLNTEFDDDLFTVAASRAEWVYDVDAGTSLHVGGKTGSIAQESPHRWRAVGAACLIAAVVAVAGIVAWRWWKRRNA